MSSILIPHKHFTCQSKPIIIFENITNHIFSTSVFYSGLSWPFCVYANLLEVTVMLWFLLNTRFYKLCQLTLHLRKDTGSFACVSAICNIEYHYSQCTRLKEQVVKTHFNLQKTSPASQKLERQHTQTLLAGATCLLFPHCLNALHEIFPQQVLSFMEVKVVNQNDY